MIIPARTPPALQLGLDKGGIPGVSVSGSGSWAVVPVL